MPLTDTQLKAQVLVDIQDDGTIAPVLDTLWTKNDAHPLWGQYLNTRLDAINILIAKARGLVRFSGDGRSMDLQQAFDHLLVLREMFLSELSASGEFSPAPSVEQMTTVVTLPGIPGYPDPNDLRFLGDPVSEQIHFITNRYT